MSRPPTDLLDDVAQDWGREPADRWIRLMADISAPGVWHIDGSSDVAESLPISRQLMRDIYAWQASYDEEERRQEAGTAWEMRADWDIGIFSEAGCALALRLKRELPAWTIVYFDLKELKRLGGYGCSAPRQLYEYEVTLTDGKKWTPDQVRGDEGEVRGNEGEVDHGSSPG